MPRRVVNGRSEAEAALRAGVTQLVSPEFAACHAGVGYYATLIASLQSEFPNMDFLVCCGDNPAIAQQALRTGISTVRCDVDAPMLALLNAIAKPLQARVETTSPA